MTTAGNKSRRDRTIIATVVVVVLYALAALVWFTSRSAAWTRAKKAYDRACAKVAGEKALIAKRDYWMQVAESKRVQMPTVEDGEKSSTRWERVIESLADAYHVDAGGGLKSEGAEEERGEVWEQAVSVTYVASFQRLVEFLYAVNTSEDAMMDVKEITIAPKRSKNEVGALHGKIILTCAYIKGDQPESSTK